MRLQTLTFLAVAVLLCTAFVPNDPTPAAAVMHTLTIQIRDAGTQIPMAARLGVFDLNNQPYAPNNHQAYIYQSLNKQSYFYGEAQLSLSVPEGDIRIHAGHGFEYEPQEFIVNVTGDMTVTIDLERFTDMNADGWYSGDTHVHITHGPIIYNLDANHLRMMTWAEDLNFVNAMEQEDFFTGEIDPLSSPDHILYFSKEHRNPDFSHLTLLGLKEWIPDVGCGDINVACALQLDSEVYDTVHGQGDGCAVIATHPFPHKILADLSAWPGGGIWRAMPMDLVGGTIDAMDILCYTQQPPPEGTEHYFNALTAGFRLAPSAGTDAIMATGASKPLGGYRVYVEIEDGEPFTMDSWIEALVAGRSFVTNYPLIRRFEINGVTPGGTVKHQEQYLTATVEVDCVEPFDEIVIMGDTGVITTLTSELGPVRHLEETFLFDAGALTWIVAIVNGTNGSWHLRPATQMYAQSAPIYLEGAVQPPAQEKERRHKKWYVNPHGDTCRDAGNFFIDMLAEVDSIFNDNGVFTDSSKAAFDSAMTLAFDHFASLCHDPPEPFQLLLPTGPGGMATTADPQPTFVWERTVDLDPGDHVSSYRLLITEDSFEEPAFVTQLPDTAYKLPRFTIQPGRTYKWRVEAIDNDGLVRFSSPNPGMFVFEPLATGVPDKATRRGWHLESPHPNPFNPSVEISYNVGDADTRYDVSVFDAKGRRVVTLFRGTQSPGQHVARWDGQNADGAPAASGVYFFRLSPWGFATQTQKAVLIK